MAFNGLLQGVMQGIGSGAKAGAEIAKGQIEDQRKMDVFKQMADIEEQKLLRIDEVKRNRDVEDVGRKGEAETNVVIARGKNKDLLASKSAMDVADVAGDIKLKQTRSADSIASEGALSKLDPKTKVLAQTYAKELDVIGTAIAKSQAENTADPNSDNFKALMNRRAILNDKLQAIIGGGTSSDSRGSISAHDSPDVAEPGASSATSPRSLTPSSAAAPNLDVSTRRVYTSQGKEGAIASLQSKIKQYEDALTANPNEGLDYSKQIQGLKDQISAVQRMK